MLAHYRVLEPIGAGGMGQVFRAQDTKLGREVALKRLSAGTMEDPAARGRLLREARLAATLHHPNICTIFEVGEADGEIYIAMELVRGRPLNALIAPGGLPAETTLRYGAQIADALAHAHERGVIHRDLKCANVVIGDDGRARVLDFGLAVRAPSGPEDATRSMETTLTEAGAVVGTPGYLAPEVLRGQPADVRSDLWSLGVMLYEMAAGRRPFRGSNSIEVNAAILSETPGPLPDSVPPGLRAAIQRCLQKDPSHRYHSAGEVRAALEALASDRHSAVAAAAPAGRAWMPWVVASVLIAAAAVAGLAWRQSSRPQEMLLRQIGSKSEDMALLSGTLSPDGRSIAGVNGDLSVWVRRDLVVRDLETGDSRTLALPESLSLATPLGPIPDVHWSSDGREILVTATMPNGKLSLWAIPVIGGRARLLLSDAAGGRVSPDGTHLAFMKLGRMGPELWCGGPQGEGARRLVSSDSSGVITTMPTWSPAGTRLAFVRTPSGMDASATRIESVDLEGHVQVAHTDSPVQRLHPSGMVAWLPDQRMIFGLTEPPPSQSDLNLWSLKVNSRTGRASGPPRRLTRWTRASLLEPMASADGKRLVAVFLTYQSDCYVARIAGGDSMLLDVARLTHDDRSDVQPAWLPGEHGLLFASDRNGSMDIFQQALTAPDAEPLVTGPGEQFAPSVSPDGAWLLYAEQLGSASSPTDRPAGAGVRQRIRRMPLAGGPPETVCNVPAGTGFRCARAPASRCVMAAPEGARTVFAAFDPVRGRGAELGKLDAAGLQAWDLSPDGRAIAYVDSRDSTAQIHVWSLTDGARLAVRLDHELAIVHLHWDAGSRGWFAVVPMADPSLGSTWRIYRIDPDGKTRSILAPQLWMYGFAVSPDGKHLAFTSNTGEVSGWLLENF